MAPSRSFHDWRTRQRTSIGEAGAGRAWRRSQRAKSRPFRSSPVHVVHGGVIARDGFSRSPHSRRRPLGFGGARAADVLFRDAAERWLATYVPTTRNAKGQRLAAVRFARYAYGELGNLALSEVSGDHIREYRLWLEHDRQLSPHTVTHVLSDLRCLLRWAVSVGLLERSPFPPRVMPRIAEVPPRGFTAKELAILTSFVGHGGFALRFLLGTGLRWAEACRATRDHVRGLLLEVGNTKSGRAPCAVDRRVAVRSRRTRL